VRPIPMTVATVLAVYGDRSHGDPACIVVIPFVLELDMCSKARSCP